MRSKLFLFGFVCFTVLTIVGTVFYLFSSKSRLFVDYSYYLLLSDGGDAVEVFAGLDYDRGGSGATYHGKSVLHYYPSEELALFVASKNEREDRKLTVQRVSMPLLYLSDRDRMDKAKIERKLASLDGVAMLLYSLSNELETCRIHQKEARSILQDGIKMLQNNGDFHGKIGQKIAKICDEIATKLSDLSVVRANDLRKIGMMICLEIADL